MGQTLGKRIAANRKRLGITQDRLAEQLGVTAQAVSKWENDQSCPDIAMLPKLAEIFGVSVDTLLGLTAPEPVHEAEVISTDEAEASREGNNWEFHWEAGKTSRIWFAIWVLLLGGLMLLNYLRGPVFSVELWDMAWPSGLLLFGLSGLYPKFSFFRLGCALFGGYSLTENMHFTGLGLSHQLLLIIALLLFGLSLLADAIRKPHEPSFFFTRNGKALNTQTTSCSIQDDSFDYSVAFGSESQRIDLPCLRRADVEVCFGELTIDLSGCEALAPDCQMDAECAFGKLCILVPRRYRAEVDSDTACANVTVSGQSETVPRGTIRIEADASFGEILIRYI